MDNQNLPPEFLDALQPAGGAPGGMPPGPVGQSAFPPGQQQQQQQQMPGFDPMAPQSPPTLDDLGEGIDPVLLAMMAMVEQDLITPPVFVPDEDKPGYRRMPDDGDILARCAQDKTRHQALMDRMSRDLSLYRQHRSGIPSDFDEDNEIKFVSAAISNLVNRLSSMMAGLDLVFEVPFRDVESEQNAQVVEDFGYWSRDQDRTSYARLGGSDLQRDEFWFLFLYGRLVARVLPDVLDDRYPFTVSLLDPSTCFPTFGAGKNGLIRMSRRYKATIGEILETYAPLDEKLQDKLLKKLGLGKLEDVDLNQVGDVIEYWDTWNRATFFMDISVLKEEHKLGVVPFVYRVAAGEPPSVVTPNGLYADGAISPSGNVMVDNGLDLAEKGSSVFHHLVNTHLLQEAMLTILYGEVEKMRNPATITYSAPHLVGKVPPPLKTKAGANNQRIKDMQVVESIPTSPRPTDVAPVMQRLQADWFGGSLNPAAQGMEMGANASGYSLDTLIAAARELVIPYVKAFETFQQDVLYLKLREFRDIVSPIMNVSVPNRNDYGPPDAMRDLTIDVIQSVGLDNKVKLLSVTDQNLPMRVQAAASAQAAGLFSQKHAMNFVGIKNPKRMLDEILLEKGMQHPMVMEALIIPQAMIDAGNAELAQIFLQLAVAPKVAQGVGGGGPGGPGGNPLAALLGGGGPPQQGNADMGAAMTARKGQPSNLGNREGGAARAAADQGPPAI